MPPLLLKSIPGVGLSCIQSAWSGMLTNRWGGLGRTYTIILRPKSSHSANRRVLALCVITRNNRTIPTLMGIPELKSGVVSDKDVCEVMPERRAEGIRGGEVAHEGSVGVSSTEIQLPRRYR